MRVLSKIIMFALFIASSVNKSASVDTMELLQYGGGDYGGGDYGSSSGGDYSSPDSSSTSYDTGDAPTPEDTSYGSEESETAPVEEPTQSDDESVIHKNIKNIKIPKEVSKIIKVIAKKIIQPDKKPKGVSKRAPKKNNKPKSNLKPTKKPVKPTKKPIKKFEKLKSHPKPPPKKVNKDKKPNKRPTKHYFLRKRA